MTRPLQPACNGSAPATPAAVGVVGARATDPAPLLDFILREPTQDDLGFICGAWLKGVWETPPFNLIPRRSFIPNQTRHMQERLARARTLVACFQESPTDLLGFVCYDRFARDRVSGLTASQADLGLAIHWLYVRAKPAGRLQGVASRMLDQIHPGWRDQELVVTQVSKHVTDLRSHGFRLVFDPYWTSEGP